MLQQVVSRSQPQLHRILGMRDLIFLVVGTVIGSGIFLVPGTVLRSVGNSVSLATLVWLAGGLLSLLGALTYGELTALKPQAGGLYVFIRDCFGPLPAFLFGWTLFFVISTGSIATLVVAFGNYLTEFVPLNTFATKLVSVLVILISCTVNVRGTRGSADLQNIATTLKVVAIAVMAAALLYFGKQFSFGSSEPSQIAGSSLASGFGVAMIAVLWAYEGWQYVTYSAGETVDPQRTFPRAFLIGSAILMGLYVSSSLGYIAALGPRSVAASNRVAATAVSAIVGPVAAKIVAAAILISMFSAAHSIVLTAPRVYYAMAKDGLFFERLAHVHPRFGTPALAIVAGSIWSAVLALTGTFEQLLTYVVFIGWIFYALAAASVFAYRRRQPDLIRPYRVPGYPVTPLLFILAAAVLVANTIITQPARSALGLGIVLVGLPAYFLWSRNRKERYEG